MRNLLVALLITVFGFTAKAQQTHEIGPCIGFAYYLGDLVNNRFFSSPKLNYGAMYRYNVNTRFAVRIAAHFGKVAGDSKDNKPNLRYRNLAFESPLMDIEGGLEINFLEYQAGSRNHRFSPFIFAGLSIFKFNPKAKLNGVWYDLQPLGTEGQGTTAYPDKKPYKLTALAIPFGAGIKWSVSPSISLGFEFGLRKTFTDYLDDVSTTYADPSLLSAEKTPISAMLSTRMFEDEAKALGLNLLVGSNGIPLDPVDYATYLSMMQTASGSQRGSIKNKDWYGIANVTILFKIRGPRSKSCPAYKKQNYFKEYNL